jgi:hypothetical protein
MAAPGTGPALKEVSTIHELELDSPRFPSVKDLIRRAQDPPNLVIFFSDGEEWLVKSLASGELRVFDKSQVVHEGKPMAAVKMNGDPDTNKRLVALHYGMYWAGAQVFLARPPGRWDLCQITAPEYADYLLDLWELVCRNEDWSVARKITNALRKIFRGLIPDTSYPDECDAIVRRLFTLPQHDAGHDPHYRIQAIMAMHLDPFLGRTVFCEHDGSKFEKLLKDVPEIQKDVILAVHKALEPLSKRH